MENMISEIFYESGLLFIIIGCFIALAFGIGLIFKPETTLRLNDLINTRISMRQKTKTIETPIKSEAIFYRYAKLSGSILIIGSLYVIYILLSLDLYSIIPALPKTLHPQIWQWLLDASTLFFLISCALITVFGFIVLIRPSSLKNFEARANTWISTRKGFQGMNKDINFLNKLVLTYPRPAGVYISLFSIMILAFLLPRL